MGKTNESSLRTALEDLPPDVQTTLQLHGFDPELLVTLAAKMRAGELQNHVSGTIEPPMAADLVSPPAAGSAEFERCRELGEAALRAGQCALVVLAGGMATRMGGVVKALVPASQGRSFLELRLAEQAHWASRYGAVPPLWLMTSVATESAIRAALAGRLDQRNLCTFVQGLSVRLTEQGELFRDGTGAPSLYSPGHGDLPDALARSGLLRDFVERGGKYVLVTNIDNLGGGLDPVLIGMHLSGGAPVSCEVVDKLPSDRGGIPARVDGRPVILEEFRIPPSFDPQTVRVFNVNSFGFDAKALSDLHLAWTYFLVKKSVDGQQAIQFERLINEVTFHLETRYLRVPREGRASRFLPIKDHEELARRQAEISELAAARGMLPPQV